MTVSVLWLFNTVLCVGMYCVIVVFSDHTSYELVQLDLLCIFVSKLIFTFGQIRYPYALTRTVSMHSCRSDWAAGFVKMPCV